MNPTSEIIDQVVLNINQEIYDRIEVELNAAESEILIATTWFTDLDLFLILQNKLNQGVRVEVIMSENLENERLDFNILKLAGAIITKVKKTGYGMMHEKFCVIDRKIALHGSYNWTVNAKKNNQESIIVTDHSGTVESLVSNFKEKQQNILKPEERVNENQTLKTMGPKADGLPKDPYERMLDTMIAAEVSNFDRLKLKNQGYERAQSNNGDHQILNKALDTLYSGFINDIDVVEDKKRRLLAKIDEQEVKILNQFRLENELEIKTLELEHDLFKENLGKSINNYKAKILVNNNSIDGIKNINIIELQKDNTLIETEINNLQLEFIKPDIKWTEIIPISIINIALFLYLFIFYSSAAYILIYSINDAYALINLGINNTQTPQIFDSNAISNALNHGLIALLFISLFTIIPIAFALINRFDTLKKKIFGILIFTICSVIGIILVDTAIAYEVSHSLYLLNGLKGGDRTEWNSLMVFSDPNFYLVFVMGTMGLLLFKATYEKLNSLFDERNPDVNFQRNRLTIDQKKLEIKNISDKIFNFKLECEEIEKQKIQLESELLLKGSEIDSLPITKAHKLLFKKSELAKKIQTAEATTTIYKTHVENDKVPISLHALKDRINIFLQGWNDYLHTEYSISKATEKSSQADDVAINWESNKLLSGSVDSRIKA